MDKSGNHFRARIYSNGRRIELGRFNSEIDAARAYDRAAIKYHTVFARLNFPMEDYANETIASHQNTDKYVKNEEEHT